MVTVAGSLLSSFIGRYIRRGRGFGSYNMRFSGSKHLANQTIDIVLKFAEHAAADITREGGSGIDERVGNLILAGRRPCKSDESAGKRPDQASRSGPRGGPAGSPRRA